MFPRLAAALFLCVGVAACNQSATPDLHPAFRSGQGDLAVLDARFVGTAEGPQGVAGGATGYIVSRVELTNDFGYDAIPDVHRFFLVAADGTRHEALDDGSAAFVGISNSQAVLKQNDKRVYTIGFRASAPTISGTIIYER